MGEHMKSGPATSMVGSSTADSLQAVWHAHRRWVAAVILAHKPREAEVEDLLQDVAMQLVRNADLLRDPTAVKPWLRTVAANVARTAGRRQSVRRRVFASTEADADSTPAPSEDTSGGREEGRRALEAARALPEEYREPLLLRAVRGMSYRQIADVLGLPVTTIETRLVRARKMVREAMERDEQESGVVR
jgi:RNA polymerase sigma-70 factor (ECF subfamily)